MKISIKMIKNENEIIANCPELDINCYGSNENEAIRRIKNVIHFYLESAKELGLEIENFNEISIEGEANKTTIQEKIDLSINTIN